VAKSLGFIVGPLSYLMEYMYYLCNTKFVSVNSSCGCPPEKKILEIINNTNLSKEQMIGKCISVLENVKDDENVLGGVFGSDLTRSHPVGVTGPPGVGKSTLISSLIRLAEKKNFTIAVLAIDPSSELTGGAFLGDRVRINSGGKAPKAFIRSIASRKSINGLPDSISNMFKLLDYFLFDFIFLETTGVGQLNTDIRTKVPTLINVISPNNGDEIQFAKAGLMEIGDIFFVNKSDLSDGLAISSFLNQKFNSISNQIGSMFPRSLHGSANLDTGTEELLEAIIAHKLWYQKSR
jgi:LAO/AO transport system kinase